MNLGAKAGSGGNLYGGLCSFQTARFSSDPFVRGWRCSEHTKNKSRCSEGLDLQGLVLKIFRIA